MVFFAPMANYWASLHFLENKSKLNTTAKQKIREGLLAYLQGDPVDNSDQIDAFLDDMVKTIGFDFGRPRELSKKGLIQMKMQKREIAKRGKSLDIIKGTPEEKRFLRMAASGFLIDNPFRMEEENFSSFTANLNDYLSHMSVGSRTFTMNPVSYFFDTAINRPNQYMLFAEEIKKIYGDLKGVRILDVASGGHCFLSECLTKMGAIVTAMDPLADPRDPKFAVEKREFTSETDLTDYDLIVSRHPLGISIALLDRCMVEKKSMIVIPSPVEPELYDHGRSAGYEIRSFSPNPMCCQDYLLFDSRVKEQSPSEHQNFAASIGASLPVVPDTFLSGTSSSSAVDNQLGDSEEFVEVK